MDTTANQIQKTIDLKAPIAKVWAALSDYQQFGQWFGVKLDQPFVAGQASTGHMTMPEAAGLPWRATIDELVTQQRFSMLWHADDHPLAGDSDSEQPKMRVCFELERSAQGTLLTITESGFSQLSPDRRFDIMRSNEHGWAIQSENIKNFVEIQTSGNTMNSNDDQIQKAIELNAPVSKVWAALSDYQKFGQWFQVKLDQPFAVGEKSTGHMEQCGPWLATIEELVVERRMTFRWHIHDEASDAPIAEQPQTLVCFELEPTDTGTRLTVTESGFSKLAPDRRLDVMRGNTEGWEFQCANIKKFVEA